MKPNFARFLFLQKSRTNCKWSNSLLVTEDRLVALIEWEDTSTTATLGNFTMHVPSVPGGGRYSSPAFGPTFQSDGWLNGGVVAILAQLQARPLLRLAAL